MGVFPILMNVLQFWIIDSIVKASSRAPFLDLERGEYHDQEPLFRAPSEDADNNGRSLARNLEPRHARSSISSVDSRELDDHSFATDTPPEEYKSSASSSRQVSDAHNYPPSLSSSFSSDAATSHSSKGPREAKNLQKKAKRRDPSSPLPHPRASLRIVHATPSPKHATIPLAEDSIEWTESWDDANDWERENHSKQNNLPTPDQWNNPPIQVIR